MNQKVLNPNYKLNLIRLFVFDFALITFIYFIPTLSHVTSIPFYMLEPMRVAIVFCIIYTNRKNSLIIALTLPIFSFIISAHPVFYKSLLVALELFINISLFYEISKRLKNIFIVMVISIMSAKIFYYLAKYIFLNISLISGDLIATSIWIQFLIAILLSLYAAIVLKKNEHLKLS